MKLIVNIQAVMGIIMFSFFMAMVPAAEAKDAVKVLAFGDSLSAGYGLPKKDAFPYQLELALKAQDQSISVVNGGVSGDTTAGGRSRLDWLLSPDIDVVVIELGANDGLRGLDPALTRQNLDWILTRLKEKRKTIILSGMMAPPNLGADYGSKFNAIYPDLAKRHNITLDPFFLQDVAAIAELNQKDGIHPNAKGVKIIAHRLAGVVITVLAQKNSRPRE